MCFLWLCIGVIVWVIVSYELGKNKPWSKKRR
jgi:hypothetical protein